MYFFFIFFFLAIKHIKTCLHVFLCYSLSTFDRYFCGCHIHNLEIEQFIIIPWSVVTCCFPNSNFWQRYQKKLYFGQWLHIAKMCPDNAIWLLKKNMCMIKLNIIISYRINIILMQSKNTKFMCIRQKTGGKDRWTSSLSQFSSLIHINFIF
jgi:hypothetical protein